MVFNLVYGVCWMTILDPNSGFSESDDIRLLIASGLIVSPYTIDVIRQGMNLLGEISQVAVENVLDLIDQFEAAQIKYAELNMSGDSKTLIKADVLEWKPGGVYSIQGEVGRIRGLIYQYMALCPLYSSGYNPNSGAYLVRS